MKTVYTCFCTDIIHEGHLNIIEEAHKLGGGDHLTSGGAVKLIVAGEELKLRR